MRTVRTQQDRREFEMAEHYLHERLGNYPKGFVDTKLEEAKEGDWRIENFTMSLADAKFTIMREARNGMNYRAVPPGTYTALKHGGEIIMSNTPAECWEHQEALMATGKVLVAGLGIGMVLGSLIDKDDVTEVVVVEKHEEVIKLVGPYFENHPKVTIVHSDIFDFEIDDSFDYCWFDIWTYVTGDSFKGMVELTSRAIAANARSGCWSRRLLAVDTHLHSLWEDIFGSDPYEWLQEKEAEMEDNFGQYWSYSEREMVGGML